MIETTDDDIEAWIRKLFAFFDAPGAQPATPVAQTSPTTSQPAPGSAESRWEKR